MRILKPCICLLLALNTPTTAQTENEPQQPRTTPAAKETQAIDLPESLIDAVTLRVTFDAQSLQPDMAAGEAFTPLVLPAHNQKSPAPEFEDGIHGAALVLGTEAGLYPRQGNVVLERRGAIALWIKPLEWKRPNGSNVVFLMTSGARFYLQRQGPMRDEDGRIRRHEAIQFLAKSAADDKRFASLTASAWENGTWHLLVACWDWPGMWLSIDGKPFSTTSLHAMPAKNLFGKLIIGARGGDRALLDEVWAFSRPLELDEAKALYELYR